MLEVSPLKRYPVYEPADIPLITACGACSAPVTPVRVDRGSSPISFTLFDGSSPHQCAVVAEAVRRQMASF
jgi:hypothetical protein